MSDENSGKEAKDVDNNSFYEILDVPKTAASE